MSEPLPEFEQNNNDIYQYEVAFDNVDQRIIRKSFGRIEELQAKLNSGLDIEDAELNKLASDLEADGLLMSPLRVSGKIRSFTENFDEMGDDIPTIFKELDNRTDDEGEYKMMVDETVVFDYVDVAYVDGFPEIRLSLQTYDDFMDDNAYLSEMFIFPRDVFECTPKHPSTESLREQMAYHYPSEYKKQY